MAGGRPKKPTALHDLQGTARPSRTNELEPVLTGRLPDRPEWVDEDQLTSALYDQVAMYVHNMGVATEVDGIGLSMLADQLAIYIEMRRKVREEGTVITVKGSSGQDRQIPHPCLPQMQSTITTIHKFLREYGLTPSSRPNVSVIDNEETVNTLDDFLNL